MTGDNEVWTKDGWVPDCRCGVCRTCLPALKMPDCELGEN